MNSAASSPDPRVGIAIERGEERRSALEELSDLGMGIARDLAVRAAKVVHGDEPRHDPARAFAQVARAVRFALALESREEDRILALRRGDLPKAPFGPAPAAAPAAAPASAAPTPFTPWQPISKDSPDPHRNRIRDAVWMTINETFDVATQENAYLALDRLHERLIDGNDYDALVAGPWRECVQAICANLGLKADWERWSDEAGFARDETLPRYRWEKFWRYDPEVASRRRLE